ncbi:MAG: YceI family protein [Rhodobacter sp.]|nr:YceI family protein [Rhodobacter sp.]
MTGADLLDAAQFPELTFPSTAIALTGDRSADVTGDLTLHGATRPGPWHVTCNGGWGSMPMDPTGARSAFPPPAASTAPTSGSASASLRRAPRWASRTSSRSNWRPSLPASKPAFPPTEP